MPFVPEVLADFVDLVEAADDQALEVELVGDPEVVVLVEVVVAGDERLREPAAVARLPSGGLDFDEALRVEPASGLGDDPRSREAQVRASSFVHQQVEVALAVARLRVLDAMEGVRQRPLDLREQGQLVDGERGLAPPCLRRPALGADDVAEVEVDGSRPLLRAQQLDPA